jgi:phage shock protein C
MEPKRLYRSRKEQMVAGICGGIAEYFAVDPTIVRLVFVLLALLGGPGLLIYIVLWIVIPEEPVEGI